MSGATLEVPVVSVALPPSRMIVEHARLAAELGYERVWVYDSPALFGDIWVALARVAEAVPEIQLATGVAIPSLRHPVVTASAIATIEDLAPGRLRAYFGTGFTARNTMGKRGMRWADLAAYVGQVRGLLAGEVVEVEGAACQLIHPDGFGPPLPVRVPIGLAPVGPKGMTVSADLADMVVLTSPPLPEQRLWEDVAQLVYGTVLDVGEDHTSDRVRDAVGPSYATAYHAFWEWAPEALGDLPGGSEWLARVTASRPDGERHLAVHEGHLVAVNELDRSLVEQAGEALLVSGWTGSAEDIHARATAAAQAGVSELVYGPAGADIGRELRAFAAAVGR